MKSLPKAVSSWASRWVFTLAAATACAGVLAQESTVPGNAAPKDRGAGRSAGLEGGAGAAGRAGTDPATLKRAEEERVRQKNGGADGNVKPDVKRDVKRKDWKD